LLSPGPAAAKWGLAVEPGDGLDARRLSIRAELEDRAVVEKNVSVFDHPVRERMRYVYAR